MFISFLPSPHQEGRAGPLASCSGWSTWTYPWPDPSLLTGAGLGISDPRGTVDPGEAGVGGVVGDGEDVVGGGAALLALTTVPVSAENTEVSRLDLPLGSSRDFRDSQWDHWEQLPLFLLLHHFPCGKVLEQNQGLPCWEKLMWRRKVFVLNLF